MSDERTRPGRHLAAFALALLAQTPDHGRNLHRRMNAILPKALRVDTGNLYRALRELEVRKMLRSAWVMEGPGPAKRIYNITTAGTAALVLWRTDISDRRDAFDWFLRNTQAFVDSEDRTKGQKDAHESFIQAHFT